MSPGVKTRARISFQVIMISHMRTTAIRGSVLFILAAHSALSQSETDIFPMRTGASWIYRGEVAWQAAGEGAKVHRALLRWKMELVDSVQRGRYRAALPL